MLILIMVPIVVLAVKVADNILQIYLIADLVSAAIIPSVFLGLADTWFWYLRGFDVMAGGLGALLGVFIFGTVYYHSAREGGKLLLIWNGLYDSSDWGPFGAFVIAPVGGVIITLASAALRIAVLYAYSKVTGKEFTALDKPVTVEVENQDHTYGSIDDDESDTKKVV